jgi:hypothetical protein
MIIQGCNSLGKMGAGIADYLKNKFPKQANEYFNYYKENGLLVGDVVFTAEKSNLYFGNIISQEKIGKDKQYIEYRGFYDGLIKVKEFCENNNINIIKTPLIGTGLAGGDWGVIEYLYKEVFKNSNILIEFYEINEKHLNSCLLKIEERNLLRKSFSKKDFPENYNFDNLKFLNNSNIKIKIDNFKKEKQKENLNIISNSVIDTKLNKYKIKITNLGKNDKYIYIGRPSLWQNPFPTKSSKFSPNVYPLEESLKKYQEETLSKLKVKNFVKLLLENNEITLSCFCIEKTITINNYKINETPKCHGELLAEKIFEALKLELTQINENQLNNNENNINI